MGHNLSKAITCGGNTIDGSGSPSFEEKFSVDGVVAPDSHPVGSPRQRVQNVRYKVLKSFPIGRGESGHAPAMIVGLDQG